MWLGLNRTLLCVTLEPHIMVLACEIQLPVREILGLWICEKKNKNTHTPETGQRERTPLNRRKPGAGPRRGEERRLTKIWVLGEPLLFNLESRWTTIRRARLAFDPGLILEGPRWTARPSCCLTSQHIENSTPVQKVQTALLTYGEPLSAWITAAGKDGVRQHHERLSTWNPR